MSRFNSCGNCVHFNAKAVDNPSEGLCQKPMPHADPVVRKTDPTCHNFKEITGTCGTCHHWIGSAEICQVGVKKSPPVWKESDPCDQYDDHNQPKYIEKTMPEPTNTTLPENTEAAVDEIIDGVQGESPLTVARSTDRNGGDCSTCQPHADDDEPVGVA